MMQPEGYSDVFGNGKVSNRLAPEAEPLTPAESRVLDIRTLQKDRAQKSRGYAFKTFAELTAEPTAKRWLIKGIFARGETSAWIAPPGAMKSALMAQAAISVAAGLDWHGYRNKETAGVVYFAIERADLVSRRMMAHGRLQGLTALPIVISSATIDMTKPDAFKKAIDTVRDAERALGVPIGLVIIDTFAKLIAAAGGDENSAKDQGAVFANVQRLKNATDTHCALVGHTGKNEERGARGSNALLGDVDVMVTLSSAGEIRTATVTKANDAPEGTLFSFKSETFEFGTDEDGDQINVNVVSSEEVLSQVGTKSSEPKLTGQNQKLLFRILHEAGDEGLTLEEWNSKAREAGITRKATLTEARYALLDKKMVRNSGDRWNVQHDG